MRTASAIGAEEMTIDIQATVAPRVGEGVVGGQRVNHVERAQTSEPERRPAASSELSLATRDDFKVIKVSIVKEDWAKLAEVLPHVVLNDLAATGALDEASLKNSVSAT